ncbi:MAG: hypothetical protein LAKADJCE_00641 [Candidatus Argoarchaeum ethanivorans]|uniref:ATP synthase archaeal subunit H n=1 Tax=Candidatus Argoarchaeum ethanivorans TaxID=2608793 RepID=A0A811T9W1_9EURY|nr:MAG: hypothetical protein LAKADJCE_00641 [Candidatus Argoarchaeum ethanivorans]
MAKTEILSQIKKAEEDVNKMVLDAVQEKERKIKEANDQTYLIIKTAKEESNKYRKKTLENTKELIKEEREKIISAGAKEADIFRQKSQKNMDDAVDFLVNEFERTIV